MLIEHNEVAVDLWQIIAHYGYRHQKEKAIEELSELEQALARDLQGDGDRDNIAEEMADVYITLAQLELIYGNHHEVVDEIREKMGRTLERVEAERKGRETAAAGTPHPPATRAPSHQGEGTGVRVYRVLCTIGGGPYKVGMWYDAKQGENGTYVFYKDQDSIVQYRVFHNYYADGEDEVLMEPECDFGPRFRVYRQGKRG